MSDEAQTLQARIMQLTDQMAELERQHAREMREASQRAIDIAFNSAQQRLSGWPEQLNELSRRVTTNHGTFLSKDDFESYRKETQESLALMQSTSSAFQARFTTILALVALITPFATVGLSHMLDSSERSPKPVTITTTSPRGDVTTSSGSE